MKNARRVTLFILIAIFALLFMAGCEEMDHISSVSLKDHDANSVIEMMPGDFDYHAYTVVVSYASGRTETLAFSEEMILDADQLKFYQVGDHDITISLGGQQYTFNVTVKRATFEQLTLPENNVFTYDGTAHMIEVQGDLPANAVVTYPGGNSFTNAGTYNVVAIVSCEGYVTQKLYATVTVERAKYDMSGVTLESKEVVYNGSAHSLTISGKLPEGVSAPIYTINEELGSSAIAAGEYKVTASFSNNDPNYEAIPVMEATLTITPAEYVLRSREILFKGAGGKAIDGATKVYDGSTVTFELSDQDKLSSRISVSFSVQDQNGNVISTSNRYTNIVNAGVYTVKAEFVLDDSKNYLPIEPIVREFTVRKAKYDMTEVHFDNDVVGFDGLSHRLLVELPDGHGIQPSDITYEYYFNGMRILDSLGNPVQSVMGTGEYTVKAIFNVTDENYEQVDDMVATLRVEL